MKGQAETVDLIGMAAAVVVIILIAGVFQQNTIQEALLQVAAYTGPAAARDLAGMLTISAAAPNYITIDYYENPNFVYSLDVNPRTVTVVITKGTVQAATGQSDTLANFQQSVSGCNKFTITNNGGQYAITCTALTSAK